MRGAAVAARLASRLARRELTSGTPYADVKIGVPKESLAGEQRVSITPVSVAALKKLGVSVLVQSEAGAASQFTDAAYREAGATVVPSAVRTRLLF